MENQNKIASCKLDENLLDPGIYCNDHDENIMKGERILTASSMIEDLKKLSLSEDLFQTAVEIHNSLRIPSKRNGRRKKMLFLCVFYAYNKLGYDEHGRNKRAPNPKAIAKMVNLDVREMQKAFALLQESETQFRPVSRFYRPVDYIEQFCEELHLIMSNQEDLIKMCNDIYDKDSELNRKFPQVVAGGILMYYMDIHGIKYIPSTIANLIGKSETTLNAIKNKVATVHNS